MHFNCKMLDLNDLKEKMYVWVEMVENASAHYSWKYIDFKVKMYIWKKEGSFKFKRIWLEWMEDAKVALKARGLDSNGLRCKNIP